MHFLDYFIVCCYLLCMLAIGFISRHNQDQKDYFLAGRSLPWQTLTLSVMATQLSAVSFVSAPAFVGLREGGGLIWLSYELAIPLAMLFLAWRFFPLIYQSGVLSVYDFLENRFGVSTRLLVSGVFQVSRSFATGIMIYAIAIILQGTMGLALWQSVLLIGVVTLMYSLQGGMRAVVIGDAIQMLLIIVGAALCLGFALHELGGWQTLLQQVEPERLATIRWRSLGLDGEGFGFLPMLFGGFVLYVSYYGCDQSEAQRALSARSVKDVRRMLLTAGLLRFPITGLYCMTGLVIGTLALSSPSFIQQIPAAHPDWMMPIFIVNYLPVGVVGVLVVAIMAAAMSSLSSAINSLSVVTVEDYCRYRNRRLTSRQFLLAGRYSGFCWGILTLVLSLNAGAIAPTVIEAINKVGSLFYGPIMAAFLLAIYTKRLTANCVNVGILAGVSCNAIFWLAIPQVFWFWWNLIGLLVTLLVAGLLFLLLTASGAEPSSLRSERQNADMISRLPTRYTLLMCLWFLLILIVTSLFSASH